jgi:hypothetical protein
MTDPINGVSGAQGTSAGGSYSGGKFSGEHKKHGTPAPQSDFVEISRDARDRAVVKKKKSIMEYLREWLG